MSRSVVSALIKFSETLNDCTVDEQSKLRVLTTLNDVTLTLSELSESGVGRSVRKLKSEPGVLGQTAGVILDKWKGLLNKHIEHEFASKFKVNTTDGVVAPDVNCDEQQQQQQLTANGVQVKHNLQSKFKVNTTDGVVAPDVNCDEQQQSTTNGVQVKHNLQSSNGVSRKAASDNKHSTLGSTTTLNLKLTKTKLKQVATGGGDAKKAKKSRNEAVDCLDSSSGVSFMDSLNMIVASGNKSNKLRTVQSNKRKRPIADLTNEALSPSFAHEIRSSLAEPFKRPDMVADSLSNDQQQADANDILDTGDLKFKSKQVLWVPKLNRSAASASNMAVGCADGLDGSVPPSLINMCVDVLKRHIHLVDYMGQVPYELVAPAFQSASVDDLARIERFNPQFVGLSDHLWSKHVSRKFHNGVSHQSMKPAPNETWSQFYYRLDCEEKKRLNRIISKSAMRIKEEQEARRTTLTTDVITPRQVQRRAIRCSNTPSSSKSSTDYQVPRNMSYPNGCQPSRPSTTANQRSSVSSKQGNMLSKLRKQFRDGRCGR